MANLGDEFNRLVKQLEEEEKTREDRDVRLKELAMLEDGRLYHSGWKLPFPLTDSALSQLCQELKMPASYMVSLMKINPELVAKQVNFFINQKADVDRKVRIKNGKVQGFVSQQYVPFDHLDVLSTFDEIVDKMPETKLSGLDMDDRRMKMRLTFPDHNQTFGTDIQDLRDDVHTGIDLENSEIGYRSVSVTPVLLRLVCTNGMRIAEKGTRFQQRHTNFDPVRLRGDMLSAVETSIDVGQKNLQELERAKQVPINDMMIRIEEVGKRNDLSKKRIEMIKDNFDYDPEYSLYGLVNAFTRTARDIKNLDAKTKLEHISHNILVTN